jgi:hypothetical protein
MTIERGTTASPFRRPMVVIGVPSDTEVALTFDVDRWSRERTEIRRNGIRSEVSACGAQHASEGGFGMTPVRPIDRQRAARTVALPGGRLRGVTANV